MAINVITEDRASGAQVIDGSLKFDGTSNYLTRNFGSGNRDTWTWAAWVKRYKFGAANYGLFSYYPGSGNGAFIRFSDDDGGDTLRVFSDGVADKISKEKFRDTGWYHLCIVVDTTRGYSANRIRRYVNGVLEETNASASNPDQNEDLGFNQSGNHFLGRVQASAYGPVAMSNVYFIDGQALGPGYFGFADPLTNIWRPKKFLAEGTTVNNGTDWSATIGDFTNGGNVFNGTVTDQGYANNTGVTTLTTGKFVIKNNLRLLHNFRSDGTYNLIINGVSINVPGSGTNSSNYRWSTVDISALQLPITVTSLKYYISQTSGNSIRAIEVEGVIMVDSTTQNLDFSTNGFYLPLDGNSPIGQDQSGKGNNWTPVQFGGSNSLDKATGALPILNTTQGGTQAAVGVRTDTIATSINNGTTWSNSPTVSGGSLSDATDGFDGDLSSSNAHCTLTATSSSAAANVTFTASIPNVTKVEVFAHSPSGSGDTRGTCLDTDGVTHTSATITGGSQSFHTIYEGDPITLANVGWGINQNSATGTSSDAFRAFRVNGYILKDSTTSGEGLVVAMPLVSVTTDESNLINSGSTAKTVTQTGSSSDIAASTEQNNFYASSAKFQGNVSRLEISGGGSAGGNYDFGTGDFTMECWFYATATVNTNNRLFCSRGDRENYQLMIGSNKYLQFDTGGTSYTSANNVFGLNKWHHFAVTRDGLTLRLFVDGIIVKEQASVTADLDETTGIDIGYESGYSSYINGYMQDARVYKGVAKYISNFVPAATSPDILPDTPSGVSGSSKLAKITDGAVSFDGSDDNLLAGQSEDYNFGTGSWTIECFAYFNNNTSGQDITDFTNNSSATGDPGGQLYFSSSASQGLAWYQSSTYYAKTTTAPIIPKKWLHIAVVKNSSGDTIKIYIDGKEEGSSSHSESAGTNAGALRIGLQGSTYFNGSISNLRVIKGTAVYTSNFTPPIAPLTNVTNTKLLCCQSPTSVESSAVGPITSDFYSAGVYLTATTYTDRGGSSCTITNANSVTSSSAGTNSFGLTTAAAMTGEKRVDINMGNVSASFFQSAWTLEMFFKKDANDTNWFVGTSTNGASWQTGWSLQVDGTLKWNYDDQSGGVSKDTGITIANDTWYFMRVQRTPSTSQSRLYVEVYDSPTNRVGTFDGTVQDDQSHTNNTLKIGDANGNSNNLSANWQFANVMLTAGTRRNQTVPTLSSGQRVLNATIDSLVVPIGIPAATNFNPFNTDINTVRGQETGHATLNLLNNITEATFADGNLKVTTKNASSHYGTHTSTLPMSSGKHYAEVTVESTQGYPTFGVCDVASTFTDTSWIGGLNPAISYYGNNGKKYVNGASAATYGSSFGAGNTIGIAVDLDNLTVEFFKDGVSQGVITGLTDNTEYFFGGSEFDTGSGVFLWNYGQKPFKFPPPAGFQSLNAANIRPETVITRPDQFVGVTTYSGNGGTQSVTGLKFKPDFVWYKHRSSGSSHGLFDVLRGTGRYMNTNGVGNDQAVSGVTSFDPNGFSLGSDTGGNGSGTWVAWCWKAGGSPTANNNNTSGAMDANSVSIDGVLQSAYTPSGSPTIYPKKMSIGTKQGFSMVRYEGNGSSGSTVPHGLSQAPTFIITKSIDETGSPTVAWGVFHVKASFNNAMLYLYPGTAAQASDTNVYTTTTQSDTRFTIGDWPGINQSNTDYISYIWHDVPGLQKFGIFEGNDSTDGTFVELGFKPAIVWVKAIDSVTTVGGTAASSWGIWDSTRMPNNPAGNPLFINRSSSETIRGNGSSANSGGTEGNGLGGFLFIDMLANGFKCRTGAAEINDSQTHLYCAWAESPSVNLFGGQSNAR